MAPGVGLEPTRPRKATGSQGLPGNVINFSVVKGDFKVWLESRGLTRDYIRQMLSCLRRFSNKPIEKPVDVAQVFSNLSVGQKHGMIRAFRNLLNFYEAQGLVDTAWLNLLRKNIPRDEQGFDINVPTEEEIVYSLQKLSQRKTYPVHFAIYNLILDSGMRVIEAVKLLKNLKELHIEEADGFYIATLGYMRKVKLVYCAFFTKYTMELLKNSPRTITYETARKLRRCLGKDIVAFKYLRKFANDTMTSEELNIPESTVDFIQGRTPKSIAARHYMKLKRKAVQFYPRYAEYITELRRKAGLLTA